MLRAYVFLGLALCTIGCASSSGDRAASRGGGDDLAKLQGSWEQMPDEGPAGSPRQRVVKEVKGDTEAVTTYAADGQILHAQSAKFRLGRSGRVPVYTFYDRRINAGPEQGRADASPRSYVYRVGADRFDEVWGLLPGQEQRDVDVKRWRRITR